MAFIEGNSSAKAGSVDEVIFWGRELLEQHQVIKIARVHAGPLCIKVIADLTDEGVIFARTPRRIPQKEAKVLCRNARINR